MINSSQLRTGNYINTKSGALMKVDAISTNGVKCLNLVLNIKTNLWHWHEIAPISITAEWLERFGFVKSGYGDWDGPKIEHENEIEWFCIRECGSGLFRLMGSEWPMGKPFRYVHQLQNLFFCHAEEELTIKETV